MTLIRKFWRFHGDFGMEDVFERDLEVSDSFFRQSHFDVQPPFLMFGFDTHLFVGELSIKNHRTHRGSRFHSHLQAPEFGGALVFPCHVCSAFSQHFGPLVLHRISQVAP